MKNQTKKCWKKNKKKKAKEIKNKEKLVKKWNKNKRKKWSERTSKRAEKSDLLQRFVGIYFLCHWLTYGQIHPRYNFN